jgi:hypothetical protein
MLFGHNGGSLGSVFQDLPGVFFLQAPGEQHSQLGKNELTELRFARGRSRLKGGGRCLKFSPDLLLVCSGQRIRVTAGKKR